MLAEYHNIRRGKKETRGVDWDPRRMLRMVPSLILWTKQKRAGEIRSQETVEIKNWLVTRGSEVSSGPPKRSNGLSLSHNSNPKVESGSAHLFPKILWLSRRSWILHDKNPLYRTRGVPFYKVDSSQFEMSASPILQQTRLPFSDFQGKRSESLLYLRCF